MWMATFAVLATLMPCLCSAQPSPAAQWRFYFGTQAQSTRGVQVALTTIYSREGGYGFEAPVALPANAQKYPDISQTSLCGSRPFLFSVAVPEGNYNVAVTLGDRNGESSTTVKAESRRLMLERVTTKAGQLETKAFTLNVRRPEIGSKGRVALKPREESSLDWDDKLTLEFNGTRPCLSTLEITRADEAATLYLAGDSTVVDQTDEPWAAWGQMLPRFLGPGIAVANHAESGESLKSFVREMRLDKILSTIKAGDYLFIQFAHNDQKQGPNYSGTYVAAATTYKAYLKVFIEEARSRGAVPVLVTSMHRRSFGPDGKIMNTLGDYPDAMRQVARDEGVALIDLSSMSKVFFEALGPEKSVKAFVHYPAGTFPGQQAELKDNTHFNAYGAYELARCVVKGMEEGHVGTAKFLLDHAAFDPAHPDSWVNFNIPPVPFVQAGASSAKP